jgi:hypothetical protein
MSQLPTINNCPECGPRKHHARGVSVFQRIQPMPPQDKQARPSRKENFEEEEDKYNRLHWCPEGLICSEKHRVPWLRNLEEAEAQYLEMLRKAHPDLAVKVHCTQEKESCPQKKEWCPKPTKPDGTHQSAHKMKWLIRRSGYYWPTMLEDCFKYYKGCQACQRFRKIQMVPASVMNPIIKPWPFRGWGMDMIDKM